MDEVYYELLTPIVYKWVATKEDSHECKDTCSVCFCNDKYHAKINFHENNLIELSVVSKKTNESVFYLHFQIHDLKTTTDNIKSFFCFLENPTEPDSTEQIKPQTRNFKILLSCTAGLTTSYYAYLMQKALDQDHQHIKVDAINYLMLDKVQAQYDYILLAPQISHLYHQLRQKYGNKVMMIDAIDFASGNVNKVINQVIS